MVLSDSTISKVLNAYFDIQFPGSYGVLDRFRASLKKYANINVTNEDLRQIFLKNLHYVRHVLPNKKFRKRHWVSVGVGIEGLTDIVYLRLKFKNKTPVTYTFLLVMDAASRFLYTHMVKPPVNPSHVRAAFNHFFNDQLMPCFGILRFDRDSSIQALETHSQFFSKKEID